MLVDPILNQHVGVFCMVIRCHKIARQAHRPPLKFESSTSSLKLDAHLKTLAVQSCFNNAEAKSTRLLSKSLKSSMFLSGSKLRD